MKCSGPALNAEFRVAASAEFLQSSVMAYDPALQKVFSIKGPTALSRELGVVPSALTQWKRVPAKHARRVSASTGVPLHELRPDLWDAPQPDQAA